MKFFWLLMLITIVFTSFQLLLYNSFEFVLILIVIDFIVLWAYTELEKSKKNKEKSNLLIKIENLERLTSELFEKVTTRFSNKEINKKELIEWLNRF